VVSLNSSNKADMLLLNDRADTFNKFARVEGITSAAIKTPNVISNYNSIL